MVLINKFSELMRLFPQILSIFGFFNFLGYLFKLAGTSVMTSDSIRSRFLRLSALAAPALAFCKNYLNITSRASIHLHYIHFHSFYFYNLFLGQVNRQKTKFEISIFIIMFRVGNKN